MPELPEVETVRRGLSPLLEGRRLERVESRRADLRFPLPERFAERLAGRKVERLERRAKYLVARIEGGDNLLMHLGMTGRFSIEKGGRSKALAHYVYGDGGDPRHDHVIFHLQGGARVVYNDARRFGYMLLVSDTETDDHPLMKRLGAEPLGNSFSGAYIAERARGKKVNLKSFLMDQRVVAGLGNIYVSEALYRARLSPERAARTLGDARGRPNARAHLLVQAVRAVLEEAIAAGGSTLKDYRQADGQRGAFQERFFVYDREGEGCLSPGCGGRIVRAVHAGRATFYCRRCQK